jgi:excisionase family DNA binding protein
MECVMNLEITERWLSVLEISQYLGISKETVYRWLDSKKIPAHKIGKQWKFQVSEINSWIKSGKATETLN